MIKFLKLLYQFKTAKYQQGEAFGSLLIEIYKLLIGDKAMIGTEGIFKLIRYVYGTDYVLITKKTNSNP